MPATSAFISGRLGAALFTVISSFIVTPVYASSLQVSPTKLNFTARDNARAIYLSNNGDAPIRAQISVMEWSQRDSKNVLVPTSRLISSPPMMELPAGKTQLVRIILPQPVEPDRESAYRLIIDELPGPDTVDASDERNVSFLLRYSVPVFVQPQKLSDSNEIVVSQQQQRLVIENRGQTHVKLSNVSLTTAKGSQVTLAKGLLGYVLPGQRMSWPIGTTADVSELRAHFNDDTHALAIELHGSSDIARITANRAD